jgi:hypothetical protein
MSFDFSRIRHPGDAVFYSEMTVIISRSQKFAVPPSGGLDNRLILKEPPKGGTANFWRFSIY